MLTRPHFNSRRAPSPRSPYLHRRGTIVIAMVILLVVLSLMVVGLTRAGRLDQSLSTSRIFADKAQYAAEGVANMAVREMYDASDEDGDGGIGTISNDGNSANNVSINGCKGYATSSVSGAVTTITVYGSGNGSNAKIVMTLTN